MKKVMNFIERTQIFKSAYVVVIALALGVSLLYTFALNIPTSIDNSMQVIRKIYISSDGISTTGANVVVAIESDSSNALKVYGNAQVGDINNKTLGQYASVLGGKNNYVSGDRTVVVGGLSNTVIGVESIIGAGNANIINGDSSVVVGGNRNTINANKSFALGSYGAITANNTFLWSDGYANTYFTATQPYTFIIHATNGVAIGTGNTSGMNLRVRDGTKGKIGAKYYCDQDGGNCHTASEIGSGGSSAPSAGPTGAVQFNGGNNIFSGTNKLMRNGGKLGVGIATPRGNVDVYSDTQATLNIVHGADGTSYLHFIQDEGGVYTTNFSIISDNSSAPAVYGHNLKGLDTQPIRLWTNNTERMRIDGSGNVRINNLPNAEILGTDANGTIQESAPAIVYNYISGQIIPNSTNKYRSGNGNNVYNVNTGNVGIGDSTPSYKLDVNGNGRYTNTLTVDGRGGVGIGIAPDASLGYGLNVNGVVAARDGDGSDYMRFYPTNNTAAAWKINNIRASAGNQLGFTFSGGSAPVMALGSGGTLAVNGRADPAYELKINGESRVSGTGIFDGNLGVGTSTPTTKLDVNGSGHFAGNMGIAIATPGPSLALDVGGDVRFQDNLSFQVTGTITAGGGKPIIIGSNLTVNGTTSTFNNTYADAYYYTSDRRYKDNLQTILNPLDKIMTLNGYTFSWKTDGKKDVGVVAQEVEKVFPELVDTDEAGYKSVKYGNLVAPIIEAIKVLYVKFVDQQKTLLTQQNALLIQKKEIDDLKKRMEKIENSHK